MSSPHFPDFAVPASFDFPSSADVYDALREACARSEATTFHPLGDSEEERPIAGAVLGEGEQAVSLIAGNHADEPVGPLLLRQMVLDAARRPEVWESLLGQFRFVIVPHTNPDGEARNRAWMEEWPDPLSYLRHRVREAPGRDLEFGFPAMRRENRLVSNFLKSQAPTGGYALHASLHGMALAEGAQLLIERHWSFRTTSLRDGFREAVHDEGLSLHDHNRFGEKGFFYLGPGFNTTPEGTAMRTFFRAQGEEEMAERFHDSSMEFVRSLGGDPLCLVTELPLFVVAPSEGSPGVPKHYLALREKLPDLVLQLQRREAQRPRAVEEALNTYGVHSLPVETALHLQRRVIELGLAAVSRS